MTKNNTNKKSYENKINKKTLVKNSNTKKGTRKKISPINILTVLVVIIFVLSLIYKCLSYTYVIAQDKVGNITYEIKSKVKSSSLEQINNTEIKDRSKQLTIKDIQDQVSKHVKLPDEEIIKIEKVKDPLALQESSDFYKDIGVGDYVLTYPSLKVIYNLKDDTVIRTGIEIKKW